jgi:hypothetical protein
VGERKIMFEKLLLAVTITFSLNFFLQVRVPAQVNADTNYELHTQTPLTILAMKLKK